jgi:esterase/lipase superfamily enzyme
MLRPVFFATTRQTDKPPFGTYRSRVSHYGLVDVSIPPSHEAGNIEWPNSKPDPAKHFLLASTTAYRNGGEFRANLNKALALKEPKNRDVIIFVHGFNNRFSDGLYRIAQMGHDLGLPGVAMSYSWPSAGNPLNYAYDRDSALFARDGLRRLIEEVSKSNARDVILVAHSLGSMVTMETLREISVSGKSHVMNRVGGVVLMSPDLDLDLFKTQADAIGKLPDPFIIFSSKKDRALRLIERLTGQKNRLGRLEDVAEISEYDITYIDVTAYSEGGLNHFPTANSAALLKLLSQIPDLDAALSADGGRPGLLPGTVLTVQNATTLILSPVASR